jgi:hypothetical protein
MRKDAIINFSALLLTFSILMAGQAVAEATRSNQESVGIPGTEVPAAHKREGHACYVYDKYVVFVTEDSETVGEQIKVALRQPQADPAKSCDVKAAKTYLLIPNDDANFFFGLAGDYLFIDSGTGPEPRGLTIYSLSKKKKVYTDSYSQPITLGKDRRLDFYKPSEKDGDLKDCREASKWQAEQLGVGWDQRVILDLTTMREMTVGRLRCSPRQ